MYSSEQKIKAIVEYLAEKGSHNNNQLVFDTFYGAVENNPTTHPLFHSDRGFQYTSKIFYHKLIQAGMRQSMSRVGRYMVNGSVEG